MVLYSGQEDPQMPRKGHTEEQILQALRQAEGGEKVADISPQFTLSLLTWLCFESSHRHGACRILSSDRA